MFKDGESHCANRDGTGRYDAQIELFPNGDFAMRSNLVETVCRRVNPDDWDGDGLANEIDGCPFLAVPDVSGIVRVRLARPS